MLAQWCPNSAVASSRRPVANGIMAHASDGSARPRNQCITNWEA